MKKIEINRLTVLSIVLTFSFITISLAAPDNPTGFASVSGKGLTTTTGGASGKTVTVSTFSDLKKYAEASEPYIILVKGNVPASSKGASIRVKSNKTIVGLGSDATLYQAELSLINVSNVIIRNLIIEDSFVEGDYDGKTNDFDAIQVDSSHHIWIDHCRFSNCGDGLIDLRKSCDYVTVSYVHLSNHNKAFGIGWTTETDFRTTIHHCWFDRTNQRNPSFDMGMGHLYNNYVSEVSSYGHYARGQARLVIENCVFENSKNPVQVDASAKGYISGLQFSGCSGTSAGNTSNMPFNPDNIYSYHLDPTSEVKRIVTSEAGPRTHIGEQYTGNSTSKFNLTVSIAQGNGAVTPSTGSFESGQNVALTATPASGYLFERWSGDFSGTTNPITMNMTSDKSISAYFIEDTRTFYTITKQPTPGGTIIQSPEGSLLVEGSNVTLTAVPSKGWTFSAWSGDHTGTGATWTIPSLSNNISVAATFLPVDESVYQAENGALKEAVVETKNAGFTGDAYINFNAAAASVEIPVYADDAGQKAIVVTFANGSGTTRALSVSVNGTQQIASLDFEPTTDWTTWQPKQVELTLPQGASIVTLATIDGQDGPNIDKIAIGHSTNAIIHHTKKAGPILSYNPAKKILYTRNIQSMNLKVIVFSLSGKKVFSTKLNTATSTGMGHIPLTGLTSGVYLIQLEFNGSVKKEYVNLL